MQIEDELARFSPQKDMLLTIGVFDGVHLGHRYLISQLKEQARQQNLLSGVITFRQHPQEVMSPGTKLPFLTNLAERTRILQDEGVEIIIVLSFTHELAELSAHHFVSLLKKYLRMKGLVIGPDFALGQNREGNFNTLQKLGLELSFSVTVVPPMVINGHVVSSTAIRTAIAQGDMKQAQELMGHPFSLHGQVIRGTGRGTELGFPTANLDTNSEQAIPSDGVYATLAYVNNQTHQSMTNIGKRPTFDGSQRLVEVYILDYQGNLYGQEMKIDIIERLRGEMKFGNAEELKKQMAEDVKQGRIILDSFGK